MKLKKVRLSKKLRKQLKTPNLLVWQPQLLRTRITWTLTQDKGRASIPQRTQANYQEKAFLWKKQNKRKNRGEILSKPVILRHRNPRKFSQKAAILMLRISEFLKLKGCKNKFISGRLSLRVRWTVRMRGTVSHFQLSVRRNTSTYMPRTVWMNSNWDWWSRTDSKPCTKKRKPPKHWNNNKAKKGRSGPPQPRLPYPQCRRGVAKPPWLKSNSRPWKRPQRKPPKSVPLTPPKAT